jgi:hypothetical protein
MASVLTSALCVACIAIRTQLRESEVSLRLESIGKVLTMTAREGRCDHCGDASPVFLIARPPRL